MIQLHSLSYTFCCFTSSQEYFTHLEMSPLTMNGCKVRHPCICSVQPIIGRSGESLSYQEYFAHIEKYHHKPWRAAKLDLNVYLSTAFYRKGGTLYVISEINHYFAHIEISPLTMKGCKIRPPCICWGGGALYI